MSSKDLSPSTYKDEAAMCAGGSDVQAPGTEPSQGFSGASDSANAPEAQSQSYAEYFAKHLTDKIKTHIESGEDVLTSEEMEDILCSECLNLLYPSEVSNVAQRLR